MTQRSHMLLVALFALSFWLAACSPTVVQANLEGTWATTLEATESTCEEIPVGTTSSGDVLFEVTGDQVTATATGSGAVSTGTIDGNMVTLTRSGTHSTLGDFEVDSTFEVTGDTFAGESVYTFDSGCVVTWDITGTRLD